MQRPPLPCDKPLSHCDPGTRTTWNGHRRPFLCPTPDELKTEGRHVTVAFPLPSVTITVPKNPEPLFTPLMPLTTPQNLNRYTSWFRMQSLRYLRLFQFCKNEKGGQANTEPWDTNSHCSAEPPCKVKTERHRPPCEGGAHSQLSFAVPRPRPDRRWSSWQGRGSGAHHALLWATDVPQKNQPTHSCLMGRLK